MIFVMDVIYHILCALCTSAVKKMLGEQELCAFTPLREKYLNRN